MDAFAPRDVGTYVYKDINYNENIRVLQILPGKRSSPICCVLLPGALPDSNHNTDSKLKELEYTALSYYWDDDDPFPKMKRALNNSNNNDFESLRRPGEYLGTLDARALGANILVTATSRLFRRSDDGRIEQRLLSLEILVSSLPLAFEATDPKDTIFAVLSIAKDTWNMDSELDAGKRWLDSERRPVIFKVLLFLCRYFVWPFINLLTKLFYTPSYTSVTVLYPRIQPNYRKCLSDVCADFMEYCIEKSNSLDILRRHWVARPKPKTAREKVRNRKPPCEGEKMPSWISSIERYAFGSPREAKKGRINGDSFVDGSGRSRYNASFGLAPRVHFEKRNRYDFKNDILNPAKTGEPVVKPLHAKKQENNQLPPNSTVRSLQMGEYKEDSFTGKYEPIDALWRTLVADRGPDGVNAPIWYRRACAYCLDIFLPLDPSGDWNTNDLRTIQYAPAAMLKFLDRVQAVVWRRRFFLTSGVKGKQLFGLMPNEAKEGDVVCILLGCTVPVVVRRENDGGKGEGGWIFVGESYVHGMMDGEAVTGDWPKKLEEFRLR
ncbi:ec6bdf9f-4a64-458a-8a64-e588e3541175 [Sclerotinia trifoliorum]|uniref:Ec6bdf9f-4a64-458a-8a64-e588e3541175 n=1 Tax=Sclerotinia trifoliorum TaxID=28548 RepID=A0A8H2ZU68_9HELO|nr:ec6bdf9f-4a64-458a-8a64-e588e3541175 [Sclerotinia trifoliorum]